jgi:hypothetical protein
MQVRTAYQTFCVCICGAYSLTLGKSPALLDSLNLGFNLWFLIQISWMYMELRVSR